VINKTVFRVWGNTIIFGKVIEEKLVKDWKYIRANWSSDEDRVAIDEMLALRNDTFDDNKEWHRVDTLYKFDAKTMIKKIKAVMR